MTLIKVNRLKALFSKTLDFTESKVRIVNAPEERKCPISEGAKRVRHLTYGVVYCGAPNNTSNSCFGMGLLQR